jgi:hypothetical protein
MPVSADLTNRLNISLGSPTAGSEAVSKMSGGLSSTDAVTCGNLSAAGAQLVFSSVAAVSAAGSSQGTAAALTGANNVVSGASGSNGVILPTPTAVGQEVSVINVNGTNAVKVYADNGGTGGTVNGGAGNAAASLAALKGATYLCTGLNPSAWWSMSN